MWNIKRKIKFSFVFYFVYIHEQNVREKVIQSKFKTCAHSIHKICITTKQYNR